MLRFAALFALVLLEGVNAYIRHALVMGNRLLHVSVNVKDLSKAQSFYTNTFPGLHVVPDDPQTILLTGPGKSLGIKLNSITDDIQHGNVRYVPVMMCIAYECVGISWSGSADTKCYGCNGFIIHEWWTGNDGLW